MATTISQGNELYIPFRNGKSISNSQNVPRVYQSFRAFQKHFPKHYLGDEGIALEKYVPERHGRWKYGEDVDLICSVCGGDALSDWTCQQICTTYCPHCGAKMRRGTEE